MGADIPDYRKRVRRMTLALMGVWLVVSFGLTAFAQELDFRVFGWSFSYWMAAQGSLVVYCAINAWYAWYMNRLDARFGVHDDA